MPSVVKNCFKCYYNRKKEGKLMTSRIKHIHTAITIISWLIFIGNLIWLIVAFPSLASRIGTHFGPDGKFDMIDEKKYAFYPFMVSIIVLLVSALMVFLTCKVKLGIKVDAKGEGRIRSATVLLIDALEIGNICLFSFLWNYSVINQVPLNVMIVLDILFGLFAIFFLYIIYMIAVRIKYSSRKKK